MSFYNSDVLLLVCIVQSQIDTYDPNWGSIQTCTNKLFRIRNCKEICPELNSLQSTVPYVFFIISSTVDRFSWLCTYRTVGVCGRVPLSHPFSAVRDAAAAGGRLCQQRGGRVPGAGPEAGRNGGQARAPHGGGGRRGWVGFSLVSSAYR